MTMLEPPYSTKGIHSFEEHYISFAGDLIGVYDSVTERV